jgi:hypothetical protein
VGVANFREIIQYFNYEQISYVVVGGMAVILHGWQRSTVALDLVIRLEDDNIRGALRILRDFGLKPRLPINPLDFCDESIRKQWIEQRGMMALSFFHPTGTTVGVDLLVQYPMDYDLLVSQSMKGDLNGVEIRYCGFDHLIEMKKAAGRKIDLSDVQELEMIRNAKNKSRK